MVLLAGLPVQEDFKKQYDPHAVVIENPDLEILIAENRGFVTLVGIAMPHPQHFLMALSGRVQNPTSVALRMDNAINVAVALSGAQLKVHATYFESFMSHNYRGSPETTSQYKPTTANDRRSTGREERRVQKRFSGPAKQHRQLVAERTWYRGYE